MLAAQPQPVSMVQEDTSADEAVEADKVRDETKMVCRRTVVIGSKFKKKICATKKQWAELEDRSEATTKEFQRRGRGVEPVT